MIASPSHLSAVSAADDLARTLDELAKLNIDQLRARFRRVLRKHPPHGLSRDLIARLLAHRVQERRLGPLDRPLASLLDRLARGKAPPRRLKIGTVVVREYQGVVHEVTVVADGFCWRGEVHASLSTIARAITGTNWNGPRFFGLRSRSKGQPGECPSTEGLAEVSA
jgi:hypothetical protein